jgi:transcription antitermination protein NusB
VGKRRHLSRKLALQVLYAGEYLHEPMDDVASRLFDAETLSEKDWTSFCRELVQRAVEQAKSLDAAIAAVLAHWRIERLSKVDLLLLRLALCEMRHFADIPIRVTLNEYIELAKQFGTEDSSSFVNGILDKLAQDFPQKDFVQKSTLE